MAVLAHCRQRLWVSARIDGVNGPGVVGSFMKPRQTETGNTHPYLHIADRPRPFGVWNQRGEPAAEPDVGQQTLGLHGHGNKALSGRQGTVDSLGLHGSAEFAWIGASRCETAALG